MFTELQTLKLIPLKCWCQYIHKTSNRERVFFLVLVRGNTEKLLSRWSGQDYPLNMASCQLLLAPQSFQSHGGAFSPRWAPQRGLPAFRASVCLCHCVQMCGQGRGSPTNLTRHHPHRSHICAPAQISLLPPTTTSICCRRRTPLCSNSPIVSRLAHLEPHPWITSAQNPDAGLQLPPSPTPSLCSISPVSSNRRGFILSVLQRQCQDLSVSRGRVWRLPWRMCSDSAKPASDWLQPLQREEGSAN